jgi:anthranilate phosphoribosyltransferase
MENAATIRDIFAGKSGPQRDIVVVNAAAALVAANVAPNFLDGARLATKALNSGAAREKLAALAAFTHQPK